MLIGPGSAKDAQLSPGARWVINSEVQRIVGDQ